METRSVRTAGGIVLGDSGTVAMVLSENSKCWLFPKGHIEDGETDEDAARREIMEETGLTDLEYLDDLGGFTRTYERDGYREEKEVRMFLFAAPMRATLAPSMEIMDARWVSLKDVPDVLGSGAHPEWFSRDRAWFVSVFERVRQGIQRD